MSNQSSDVLARLAAKHGTDKGPQDVRRGGLHFGKGTLSGKNYTETYGRFFGPLKDAPISFLEIGIDRGASLAMWEDFFSRAELHAIDITPGCKRYATPRTKVHIGSQTDVTFLQSVVEQTGQLDVVLDDGGHTMEQHRVSLRTLWPHLNPGGLYVIEDLHTAYWGDYGGGGADSTVEMLKILIDSLNNRDCDRAFLVSDVGAVFMSASIAVLIKSAE
jgi:hypothetical protein